MQRKKKDSIEWLEFDLLKEHSEVIHGVFLRHGGVSVSPYASLNMMKKFGDEASNVEENKDRVLKVLNLEKLISAWHVHGTHIEHVKKPQEIFLDCDGLMTDRPHLGLLATHADCQAALFYDPLHKAIANVHAGWRGQVQNIYQKTISKMAHIFGTCPEDLLVCISPSLGPKNAEFKNYKEEFPEEFWQFQIKPTYFDLWAIAKHQLESCGVLPHHIEIAKIDTYENLLDFFSYRREKGGVTGGHGTVIALRTCTGSQIRP